jgi:hypothetical protein
VPSNASTLGVELELWRQVMDSRVRCATISAPIPAAGVKSNISAQEIALKSRYSEAHCEALRAQLLTNPTATTCPIHHRPIRITGTLSWRRKVI